MSTADLHWAWIEACGRRDDEQLSRTEDSDMADRFEAAVRENNDDDEAT